MLTIAWQYLSGRSCAASFSDRQEAEWPPHPDRIFQALVAAWGERGEASDEREVLAWIESLGVPNLVAPEPCERSEPPDIFVPVNDLEASLKQRKNRAYGDALLGLLPSKRQKKERCFPSVFIGDAPCALSWPNAEAGTRTAALERLCANVIRVGHSSSLVRMWVANEPLEADYEPVSRGSFRDLMLRVPEPGRLESLCRSYKLGLAAGRQIPPPVARQQGYKRILKKNSLARGLFASRLLVFAQRGGQRFDLLQSLDLTRELRRQMILGAESLGTGAQRAKIFVSGHEPDGKPVCEPHLAYLPLAFVGAPYADGHILGMALALPATASTDDEDLVYASLGARMADDGSLTLDLGEQGRATLRFEDDPAAWSLREERWTKPSPCWASVTPIVMDRMAKAGRNDPWEWVAHEIARSCTLQGLPMPESIEISPVSFLEGSYPCYSGRTRLSSSFIRYEQKGGRTPWMFHAKLEFDEPVAGPLVLGAGRFRGYGLCAPMEASC